MGFQLPAGLTRQDSFGAGGLVGGINTGVVMNQLGAGGNASCMGGAAAQLVRGGDMRQGLQGLQGGQVDPPRHHQQGLRQDSMSQGAFFGLRQDSFFSGANALFRQDSMSQMMGAHALRQDGSFAFGNLNALRQDSMGAFSGLRQDSLGHFSGLGQSARDLQDLQLLMSPGFDLSRQASVNTHMQTHTCKHTHARTHARKHSRFSPARSEDTLCTH